MTIWVALLRGINVGGKNILPMKQLKGLLADSGYENVQTYIQSGNCVFSSDDKDPKKISATIGDGIEAMFGFRPHVFCLTEAALGAAIDGNPFEVAKSDGAQVHFYFLSEPAKDADLAAIEALKNDTEQFSLTKHVFYLYAPDGIGRSKLAARAEDKLGVMATARNLKTVNKLWSMVKA